MAGISLVWVHRSFAKAEATRSGPDLLLEVCLTVHFFCFVSFVFCLNKRNEDGGDQVFCKLIRSALFVTGRSSGGRTTGTRRQQRSFVATTSKRSTTSASCVHRSHPSTLIKISRHASKIFRLLFLEKTFLCIMCKDANVLKYRTSVVRSKVGPIVTYQSSVMPNSAQCLLRYLPSRLIFAVCVHNLTQLKLTHVCFGDKIFFYRS